MATTIQLRDLNASIRKAIADRGEDYVYPQYDGTCLYRSEVEQNEWGEIIRTSGPAGCVVGYAFDDLGVLPEEMEYKSFWEEGDGPKEGAAASQLADALELTIYHDGVDVTEGVREALNAMQGKQDAGDSWGDAYYAWLTFLDYRVPTAYAEFKKEWADR